MLTLPQSTDPQTVAPPAPYQILKAGTVTKKRDIKRIKISSQWDGIGAHEIDKVTKESDDSVYARARAPHGYALVEEHSTMLGMGDLCFPKKDGEWRRFEELYTKQDEGKTVEELMRNAGRGNRLLFAKPLPNESDNPHAKEQLSWSIPDGYRLMDVGETQRYGDKYKEQNGKEWFPVDSMARGELVPERNTKDGCYVYCRPVSPQHRYWYINRETGCDESGGGTMIEPWKSAKHAMARIEKGAATLGQRLFGTILDLTSMEGVHHFDIDEPEQEPLPVEMVSEPAEPPRSKRYTTVEDITKANTTASVRDFERAKPGKYPTRWRKQDVHRYLGRLKETFPTYRIMYRGEILKQGDLICKKVEGRRTWTHCPIEMVGTEVDDMPQLCARDSLPQQSLTSFEAKLDAMSHKLHDAIDFVSLLKADYLRLKLM